MKNMINKLLISLILIFSLYAFNSIDNPNESPEYTIRKTKVINPTDPPSIQMYYAIEKYADSFNIPKRYAYGVAFTETGYKGPFHFKYNPKQTSNTGALGPAQILISTARGINQDNISKTYLRDNIEYNIMTSMKYLRRLHNKYKNWGICLGSYNTGQPCINTYAKKILNWNWEWEKI